MFRLKGLTLTSTNDLEKGRDDLGSYRPDLSQVSLNADELWVK